MNRNEKGPKATHGCRTWTIEVQYGIKETSDIRLENRKARNEVSLWPTRPSPGCPRAVRMSTAMQPTLQYMYGKRFLTSKWLIEDGCCIDDWLI
jgi:hypothetical protein